MIDIFLALSVAEDFWNEADEQAAQEQCDSD